MLYKIVVKSLQIQGKNCQVLSANATTEKEAVEQIKKQLNPHQVIVSVKSF